MIELENVSKIFQTPSKEKVFALKNVSLKINQGEFIAIVGPSGSGKSTLMNIIGCLDQPSTGHFTIKGEEIRKKSDKELSLFRNREIGFIFQSYNLLTKINTIENVELPLVYRGTPLKQRKAEAFKALCMVGLKDRALYMPGQLSGGQQQRVAIARTLVAKPSIIFGDELTGALDSKSSQEIINIIKSLVDKQNKTVIIVTHDMDVAACAYRIIKIDQGRIIDDYRN